MIRPVQTGELRSPHLILGDCAEKMRDLADNSIDAIVTDPPYGLNFMGMDFDNPKMMGQSPHLHGGLNNYPKGEKRTGIADCDMVMFQKYMTPIFAEALRVAKPGAHLLAFGGTRTFHRLACAIEDAGWEIRDCIMWVYGSGFPKSMDVSKAIDKAMGAEREVIGKRSSNVISKKWRESEGRTDLPTSILDITAPATPEAAAWSGWGTSLKPAYEPVIMARKPLEGTVAANVLKHGTGAINIDACRVGTDTITTQGGEKFPNLYGKFNAAQETTHTGRFPANLVHDGSQMVLDLFPESKGQQGDLTGNEPSKPAKNTYGEYDRHSFAKRNDSGSAARFFYCAKASKKDRNYGCERLLTWAERDQELTQLLEQASSLLARDISESMMLNLVEQGCSTSLFGNENTVLSQEECRFITSTVIPLITASKTCSSSPRSNTSDAILDAIKTSEESGINVAQLAEKLRLLKLDSTSGETAIVMNAVNALFAVLSEIRDRAKQGNHHCTIKPLALMRYLVRLVTRKGGIVLDPFMGSGTTGVAAIEEGMNFVGIERDPHYYEIATRRISAAKPEPQTPTQQELPL